MTKMLSLLTNFKTLEDGDSSVAEVSLSLNSQPLVKAEHDSVC